MKKQLIVTVGKYSLGFGLLAYVVWKNWSPPPAAPDLAALGASSIGLLGAPLGQGPFVAASTLFPGRAEGIGIAQVIQKPLQVGPLVLASILLLINVLLTFVRWFILVRAQGLPFTLGNAFRLGLMGYALNSFLPGSVGGDVFKAYYIAKEQNRRTVAVATVLIDRAVGLWALFWLVTLFGGAFWLFGNQAVHDHPSLEFAVAVAAAVLAATVTTWFLLGVLPQWRADRFAGRLKKLPKVGPMASEFWRAVWMYRCRGRSIALALLLALTGHFIAVLIYSLTAQIFLEPGRLDQIPTLAENFVIVPIGVTWQAVFPTPGGVGGGEFGFSELYALIGKPRANGIVASLVFRILSWGLGFVGYIVYLRMRPSLPPIIPEPTETNGSPANWQPVNGAQATGIPSVTTEA